MRMKRMFAFGHDCPAFARIDGHIANGFERNTNSCIYTEVYTCRTIAHKKSKGCQFEARNIRAAMVLTWRLRHFRQTETGK